MSDKPNSNDEKKSTDDLISDILNEENVKTSSEEIYGFDDEDEKALPVKEEIPEKKEDASVTVTESESDKINNDSPFVSSIKKKFQYFKEETKEQFKEITKDFREESKYTRNERKKEFYGGRPPASIKHRLLYILLYAFKKVFSLALTSVFAIFLVFILTGTIVGTVVTVYLLSFMDTTQAIALKPIEESYASYIYQMNKETQEYEMVYKAALQSHDIKLAVDINELPDHVKYAFVCIEDERFYSHEGVDYKRTAGAILNLAITMMGVDKDIYGGSTITQQLIKNVTQDDEQTVERKMREIFSAMKFEKKYTKDEILQAYLNEIYFGQIDTYNMYGIEAASIGYFGKSATELTTTEAAMLAAIPKSPNAFNPTLFPEENKERRDYCLTKMFELGVISPYEYQKALNEEVMLSTDKGFAEKFPNHKKLTESEDEFKNPETNSWCVDLAIYEFADYLQETYELESQQEGINMFNRGGYKLYITMDTDVQNHLNTTFADWTYFPESQSITPKGDYEKIQAGMAVLDYQGHILGIAGQIGGKTGNLGWINEYSGRRQPGSTIKPITTYGYALENDHITWSSMFYDSPLPAGVASDTAWPSNYGGGTSGGYYPVSYFLQWSLNTLPAQIAYNHGLQQVHDFATQNLGLPFHPTEDLTYSSLCVGGCYTSPTVIELANAYIPYGNGGTFYKASVIAQAVDMRTGTTIIDNINRQGEPAVSEETAYVMNKLLQNVVSQGTGTSAQLWNTTVAGKTGTTENWHDITFVGLTPDYVSSLWVGYPTSQDWDWRAIERADSARIWYNVFGTYANAHASGNQFPECDTVIYARYCSSTGLLANPGCPGSKYGYYKSTNCDYCYSH